LREEEHQEAMRARRVTMERSISDLKVPKPEISKPVKRIGIPINKPTLPTMDENQTQDSFLY